MREIKFRVWDEYQDKLEYFEFPIDAESIAEYHSTKLPTHKRVWMQYTGLKDKNGNEIYEGDVVHVSNYTGYVDFENATFVVRELSDKRTVCTAGDYDFSEFEVIGNIYENPELLT